MRYCYARLLSVGNPSGPVKFSGQPQYDSEQVCAIYELCTSSPWSPFLFSRTFIFLGGIRCRLRLPGEQSALARTIVGLGFRVEALTRVALAGPEVVDSCIHHHLILYYLCDETLFRARASLSAAQYLVLLYATDWHLLRVPPLPRLTWPGSYN